MIKNKSCPFCGGEAVLMKAKDKYDTFWTVNCRGDECSVSPHSGWSATKEEAINIWNKREVTKTTGVGV
jgi:Lar family restriction alleviation protein